MKKCDILNQNLSNNISHNKRVNGKYKIGKKEMKIALSFDDFFFLKKLETLFFFFDRKKIVKL